MRIIETTEYAIKGLLKMNDTQYTKGRMLKPNNICEKVTFISIIVKVKIKCATNNQQDVK